MKCSLQQAGTPSPFRRAGRCGAALLALSVTLLASACTASSAPPTGVVTSPGARGGSVGPSGPALTDEGHDARQAWRGAAAAGVASLRVQGRGPKTGYSREQFGQAWADVDRNGCDTRNDVLKRDLTAVAYRPGTRDCVVVAGTLADPYTGQTLLFSKDHAADVQIDHVVALSDAWQKGAAQWSAETRLAFANDPLNLLAADGGANMSKSDSDAASWLPKNKAFRCAYVARQIAVKRKYAVSITLAEHDAMDLVLQSCPAEPLPTGGNPLPAPPAAVTVPSPATTASPPDSPAASTEPSTGSSTYRTCTQAKAAGAGPFYRGQPGYVAKQDADSDGVACER